MRPLCGIQHDGNRKSQGALARSRSGRVCRRQRTAPLCEFPGLDGVPSVFPAASFGKRFFCSVYIDGICRKVLQ